MSKPSRRLAQFVYMLRLLQLRGKKKVSKRDAKELIALYLNAYSETIKWRRKLNKALKDSKK